jgi:hypothetical protein
MAFMAQHILPRITDAHGMGIFHDLEHCPVRLSRARFLCPLDQEMTEAAVPG